MDRERMASTYDVGRLLSVVEGLPLDLERYDGIEIMDVERFLEVLSAG